jgi:hypothetical protein
VSATAPPMLLLLVVVVALLAWSGGISTDTAMQPPAAAMSCTNSPHSGVALFPKVVLPAPGAAAALDNDTVQAYCRKASPAVNSCRTCRPAYREGRRWCNSKVLLHGIKI